MGAGMNKLQIKHETLPQRCEICHQSDTFDASANKCSRCGDISSSELAKTNLRLNRVVRAPQFLLAPAEPSELAFFLRRIMPSFLLTIFDRINRSFKHWVASLDLEKYRGDFETYTPPISLNLSGPTTALPSSDDNGSLIKL